MTLGLTRSIRKGEEGWGASSDRPKGVVAAGFKRLLCVKRLALLLINLGEKVGKGLLVVKKFRKIEEKL